MRMTIMVSVLQMRIERLDHVPGFEPGFEPGPSNSRALLVNLTPLCFPSFCCKAVFPTLGTPLGDRLWGLSCALLDL